MQEVIKRLRSFAEYEADLADESKWERIEWEAADLIESQAAEIGVLKIAHEAHQTSNLKMLAVLKKQAAEIEKYKALCDQMWKALDFIPQSGSMLGASAEEKRVVALEAWRAMK